MKRLNVQRPTFNVQRSTESGFTLVEVLATLVLLGIVIPVAMRGVSVALGAADKAKHMSEAASLGQAKLNELVSTGDWQGSGSSGDFGTDWPDYRWSFQTAARDFNVTELVLTVAWNERGSERNLNISTMISESAANTGGTTLGNSQ